MENKLVSIIVPIYNAERTLSRCIESVTGQTYENIEIILVDDGSDDGSGRICEEYKRIDKRVRVIHKKNSGVSSARNEGIKAAIGEYIQFVDADDWIESEMTCNMVESIQCENDLAICGYNEVLPGVINYRGLESEFSKLQVYEFLKGFHYYHELEMINALWNKLYKRSIIAKHNILFNEGLSLGEDLIFNVEYIKRCNAISAVDRALYNYIAFDCKGSLSNKFNPGRLDAQVTMYESIIDTLKQLNLYENENRSYVKRAYSRALLEAITSYLRMSGEKYSVKRRYLNRISRDERVMRNISIFNNGSIKQDAIALLLKLRLMDFLIAGIEVKSKTN